ncbi:MAG TPA: hypothetical protein VIG70_15695, partial [Burkholderiales bacterium]
MSAHGSAEGVLPHAVGEQAVEVAKPGMVYARMFSRGSLSSSIVRAQTISAWVESRPPETPMISFFEPV